MGEGQLEIKILVDRTQQQLKILYNYFNRKNSCTVVLIDRSCLLVRLRLDLTTGHKDGTHFIQNVCSSMYTPTIGCEQQKTHKEYVQDMAKIRR